jgi:hypothetical protein
MKIALLVRDARARFGIEIIEIFLSEDDLLPNCPFCHVVVFKKQKRLEVYSTDYYDVRKEIFIYANRHDSIHIETPDNEGVNFSSIFEAIGYKLIKSSKELCNE